MAAAAAAAAAAVAAAAAAAAACPLTGSLTGVFRALTATLDLLMLLTAMLPMLWIELTALGRLVVDVVVEVDEDDDEDEDGVVDEAGVFVPLVGAELAADCAAVLASLSLPGN